ncbi:MAG: M28 family peptidase [Deltaproteobacteria bacterium]|nr:M28 family peptidase [Deltaproteobacteria bacterium]
MFLPLVFLAVAAEPPSMVAAEALRDRCTESPIAMEVLRSLTHEVGPRPVGTPGMTRARDWAVKKLTALGFKNVHVESFVKRDAWVRGVESATMTAPYAFPLAFIGLGNSVPTPAGGVDAELRVFRSLEELEAAPRGSLTGKIALVNQPMTRTQDGEGYGAAVKVRGVGASLAAARGAVAFLTRSVATGGGRAPHTGAMRYDDDAPRIPAAALGVSDADLLARLAARGAVRLSLSMASTVIAEAPAFNIVGEIPGANPRGDTLLIGAHLDSWDPGQGAVDDGAGVAITIAAAKLLGEGPKLKRGLRVVLFGSEETGGSSDAYAAAHVDELPRLALAAESDSGAGPLYRLALPDGVAGDPALFGLATALAPLGIFVARGPAEHGGADIDGLQKAGVPIIDFGADATHYFDIHHSADDTFDKVRGIDVNQSVAGWAVLLYFLAESGVDLRPRTKIARPE